MKDKEIYQKALFRANKNGLLVPRGELLGINISFTCEAGKECVCSTIFNHQFAKAYWGYKDIEGQPAWEYHLQKMVLEKNPIKYLKPYL